MSVRFGISKIPVSERDFVCLVIVFSGYFVRIRVGPLRCGGSAAFSRGTLSCSFAQNVFTPPAHRKSDRIMLGASKGFRPLNAGGAAAAQRPYPESGGASFSVGIG